MKFRSIKARARYAGILYVAMAILMIIAFMYIPGSIIVSGDAAATARNITERELMYRVGILAGLSSHILFVVVALALYHLFKEVNREQALLMLVLVCVGVAVEIGNLALRTAPLLLLGGANFLAVFTQAQLEALAMTFLRLNNNLGRLALAIWGLWLIPFGALAIKSGFFPKILGILLYIAGVAYMTACIAAIVMPAQFGLLSRILMPLYLGELGIVIWMAVMGAKAPA